MKECQTILLKKSWKGKEYNKNMNLSNIKKIVLQEGRVVIIDGDDALVVMSFDEYEKTKSKNLGMASALLEARPEPQSQPEIEKISSPEKPSTELTLDDLPF